MTEVFGRSSCSTTLLGRKFFPEMFFSRKFLPGVLHCNLLHLMFENFVGTKEKKGTYPMKNTVLALIITVIGLEPAAKLQCYKTFFHAQLS